VESWNRDLFWDEMSVCMQLIGGLFLYHTTFRVVVGGGSWGGVEKKKTTEERNIYIQGRV